MIGACEDRPGILRVKLAAGRRSKGAQRNLVITSSCGACGSEDLEARLEKVPPTGGDTLFASMYAAYDALSPDWQRFVDPLDAWHSSAARHGGEFGVGSDHPCTLHPVVRIHPETGRKALYVNQGFTMSVEGMTDAESRAVLDFLFRHCENPAFQVRFSWQPDSIAISMYFSASR